MSLYKRADSSYWWTKFTVGGQQVRQSTGTADRKEAAAVEARLRQQRWAVAYAGAHTWADAAIRWMAEHQLKRSHDKDKTIIAWFHQEGRLRGRLLEEINRDVLHELHQAKAAESSPATANRYMALLRAILNAACEEWEWIPKVPKVPMFRLEAPAFQWLTLEVFRAAYSADAPPWLKVAMALAVVTAQRREDVAGATFADFHDGGWWLRQKKTGARLVLPLELRLEVLDLSLADVLAQARRTGVVSRHLVHQTRPYGNSPVGSPIFVDRVSKRFSEVIAGLGLDWGDRTPPTFHEIRSLSERLYSLQGNVRTQELLGHRDARMTAVYHDVRGAEWVRVRV